MVSFIKNFHSNNLKIRFFLVFLILNLFQIDVYSSENDIRPFPFELYNSCKNLFSSEFETFSSIGYIQKKKLNKDKIELDITIDGYLPPDDNGVTKIDNFEFENKFKLSWKLTKKVKLYNLGEVSKLQSKKFYEF